MFEEDTGAECCDGTEQSLRELSYRFGSFLKFIGYYAMMY